MHSLPYVHTRVHACACHLRGGRGVQPARHVRTLGEGRGVQSLEQPGRVGEELLWVLLPELHDEARRACRMRQVWACHMRKAWACHMREGELHDGARRACRIRQVWACHMRKAWTCHMREGELHDEARRACACGQPGALPY